MVRNDLYNYTPHKMPTVFINRFPVQTTNHRYKGRL